MNGPLEPKHPTLSSCSKQMCTQIVDCKVLELEAEIRTEREKRIRESHVRLESTIQLRIENETMTMRRDLEAEIRKNHDDLTSEIRNTLKAQLSFLTEQVQHNSKSIADIRTTLSDNRENTKEDMAELKQSIHECTQIANTNTTSCNSLDRNIRQCMDALNSE